MTRAEKLHIVDGPVWIIGTSDEEHALLDPLPDGVEALDDRDEDDPEEVAAAILVVDDAATAPELLDEMLPRISSIPLVWVVLPREARGVQTEMIESMVIDYGWTPIERLDLDDAWSAVRIEQS